MSGPVARSVEIPTGAGHILTASVFLPALAHQHPTLLEITPYGPHSSELLIGAAEFYTSHGYALVIQNVAGRFGSTGPFDPFRSDASDSIDVLHWIVAQPWSNGDVATIGGSYSGLTQFWVNRPGAPMLRCQHIRQAPTRPAEHVVYRGGAVELAFAMSWALENSTLESPHPRAEAALADLDTWLWALPLTPFPPLGGSSFYDTWLHQPPEHPAWSPPAQPGIGFDRFTAPVLHLGGWFDPFLEGTIDAYERGSDRTGPGTPQQRLVVGPWAHGSDRVGQTRLGDVDFGGAAFVDPLASKLDWVGPWMRDEPETIDAIAPVRLFVMGTDRWQDFDRWPPPGSQETSLYLSAAASGTARSLNDGSLDPSPADDDSVPPTRYRYDPSEPVITHGGATVHLLDPGPKDMRETERRCSTFTSVALSEPLAVIGPVHVDLHAHSTAPDTDWVARVTDVGPSGASLLVTEGILRARYRASLHHPELVGDEIEAYRIDLSPTAHVFRRGHRLRLAVTSSNFPRWSRNLNTGGDNHTSSRSVTATNSIYHDRSHRSRVSMLTSC